MREMLSGQMQVVGDLLTQITKGGQENCAGFQRLCSKYGLGR